MEPSSKGVQQLKSMFPDRSINDIECALLKFKNDVTAAAEYLLENVPTTTPPTLPFPTAPPPPTAPPLPTVLPLPTVFPSHGQQHNHFVPDLRDVPPKLTGKRRALLIGCNYVGQKAELRGCINDTRSLRDLLMKTYGWKSDQIRILTDETYHCRPTRRNIENACRWLVQDAKPGDIFFFSFSGHGGQQEDPNGFEEDGMNETLLPLDFKNAGQISDDMLNQLLVQTLPSGAKLTAVIDACHSGSGLDLPFTWDMRRIDWKEEVNPFHTQGDVEMFSGCTDSKTSADISGRFSKRAGGAMTTAFVEVLIKDPCPTYPILLSRLHQILQHKGFRQRPVLSSSQAFDFKRPFLLDDIIPNQNKRLGRIFRRKFKPTPNKMTLNTLNQIGALDIAYVGTSLMLMAAQLLGS